MKNVLLLVGISFTVLKKYFMISNNNTIKANQNLHKTAEI
jgi:hypothetical protein